MGESFISEISKDGLIDVFTKCASIIGLMMIGGMTAANVKFTSIVEFPIVGADPVTLQSYLDAVFKGLVPLGLTYGCLRLMQKRVNQNLILVGVLALAIVLALLGIV